MYGTGWYYPPYWGRYYYPYRYSYGYGSFYNPRTGTYGTRSSWYGPYGGYSYNQYHNPRSGRHGYVETAWDGDEWASYGESYNPRTQTYREQERYYNDDNHRFESDKIATRGNNTLATQREIDLDDGWSTTERQTSKGGSSFVEGHRQADGSWQTSGNYTTADGRTGTIEGERDNGTRKTKVEGSEGGGLVSGSDGQNRGFAGKSADGDLYAGKNGSVYKKGDDGWQQYDRNDGWQSAERGNFSQTNVDQQALKERAAGNTGAATANRAATATNTRQSVSQPKTSSQRYGATSSQSWNNRSSQLNRDARARNRGYNQFNQRRSYSRGGGARAMPRGRRR